VATGSARIEPPHAALVRDFANTVDHEMHTDVLEDPDALTDWLRARQLLGGAERAAADELAMTLALRDGLRAAMAAHGDGGEGPGPEFGGVTSALPLQVTFIGSEPRLQPVQGGAQGALAQLLVAVHDCRLDQSWQRLKLCPADDCRWAFYDASKNRTRVWCSMGVCGNRTKTRTYRARHRTNDSPPAS
jgi:predicted RNA-binding Zn ribbon-like protein